MKALALALVALAAIASATSIEPPCDQNRSQPVSPLPIGEPTGPLQPVPLDGTFSCGGLNFSNFSDNILNGGLIGGDYINLNFQEKRYILIEVEPVSPELGFSFDVIGSGDAPLRYVALPQLNHVTSGDPTVTVDFGGGVSLSSTQNSGGSQVMAHNPTSASVTVEPSVGGTISALDIVFITPEPATFPLVLCAVGLGWWRFRRNRTNRFGYVQEDGRERDCHGV